MSFLTTKSILDATQTMIVDQTTAMRGKMLVWLNVAMQMIINEPRTWGFLSKTALLPVTANVITLPVDFSDFDNLTVGAYLFGNADMMTAAEAFIATGDRPLGFTIDERLETLLIIPGTTETTVTLAYKAGLPTGGYTDGTTTTIFPQEFLPLFIRYLLSARNEYDEEDQFTLSLQMSTNELNTMKKLDTQRKAQAKISRHGYTRIAR